MCIKNQCGVALALCILALPAADAGAADKASTTIVINPILETSVKWDSNFYKRDTDEKEIYTWLIQPGLEFGYITAKTRAIISGTLDGHIYGGDNEQLDDYLGYTFDLDLNQTTQSKQLSYGLTDKLQYTRNPDLIEDLSDSTSRELYMINTFTPYIGYETERLVTGLDYENKIIRYDEDLLEDLTRHKGGLNAYYKMNRTYEFGPRLEITSIDYDRDSVDYEGAKLLAVLNRNGKHVDLTAGVGYHKRKFDDPADTETSTVPWYLSITSQKTGFKNTSFSLALHSDMNELVSADQGYYTATQIVANIDRKVWQYLTLGIFGSFQTNDYEFVDRDEDVWKVGATADYPVINRLNIGIAAGYDNRDSNTDTFDYDNTWALIKLNYIP